MKKSSLKFATREKIIELMGTETCPLCLEAPTYPVTTKCGHLFCEYCIYKWLQDDKKPCPMCRAPLVFNKQIGMIRPTFISTSLHSPSSSEVGMLTGRQRKQRKVKNEDDDKVPDTASSDTLLEQKEVKDDAACPDKSLRNDEAEEEAACPNNPLPNDEVEADDSCSNKVLHHDEGDSSVDSAETP